MTSAGIAVGEARPGFAARFDRWLLAPAPAERLAAFRILAGLYTLVYLLVRLPVLVDLADGRPGGFDPVGVLNPLDGPLEPWLVHVLIGVSVAGATAVTLGAAHRFSGPGLAVALLVLTTYRSSWNQMLHFDNLVVLHLAVLALAPAADAWSIDARRRRQPAPTAGTRYGWPLRLAAIITAVTYVIAGIAKLRYGGFGWLDGATLRNHVAYSAARLDLLGGDPSPFAGPLVGLRWTFTPAAVGSVVLELVAPLALLGGRVRNVWVAAAVTMHAFIALAMFVVFPYPLVGVAFAPLFALERAPAWLRNRRPNPNPGDEDRLPGQTARN